MKNFDVWAVLWSEVSADTAMSKLVRLGYHVSALANSGTPVEISKYSIVLALRLDSNKPDITKEKVLGDMKKVLEGYSYLSIVVVDEGRGANWCAGRIIEPDESESKTIGDRLRAS